MGASCSDHSSHGLLITPATGGSGTGASWPWGPFKEIPLVPELVSRSSPWLALIFVQRTSWRKLPPSELREFFLLPAQWAFPGLRFVRLVAPYA